MPAAAATKLMSGRLPQADAARHFVPHRPNTRPGRKLHKPGMEMVAGRRRCHEEATHTAPEPAEPHGPRRCGGPEHSVGLSKGCCFVRPPGRSAARRPRWPLTEQFRRLTEAP